MSEEMVTITEKKFEQLLDDSFFLNALHNAGVDNWDGYEYALEAYHEYKGED